MTVEEIMRIEDPKKAMLAIATSKELLLNEMLEAMKQYAELHQVSMDEMTFYPNGERVITPEALWEREAEDKPGR